MLCHGIEAFLDLEGIEAERIEKMVEAGMQVDTNSIEAKRDPSQDTTEDRTNRKAKPREEISKLGRQVEYDPPMRERSQSLMSEPEPVPTRQTSLESEPDAGPVAPPSPEIKPEMAPVEPPFVQHKQLPSIARNARFRKSCYFDATLRSGCLDWCVYNHMLLPCRFDWYDSPNEEYEHLKTHACIWDVAAERQVEIVGADAVTLVELLTPRAMSDMRVGQCRYAIITDDEGMVLNDPVVSRLAEDRFWLSGADGDLILWVKGIALGRSLKVRVFEAKVSPVAIQGPKSTALMAELFGDWIYDLKYFNFKQIDFFGMPITLARSGWSPEVGYELYLHDESRGNELWDRLMEEGCRYNLKPGTPNQKRRIEGGMLNFGSDITPEHSILELGLPPSWIGAPGKCKEAEFMGKESLQRLHDLGGAKRHIMGLAFTDTETCEALEKFWDIRAASAVLNEFDAIGKLTSLTFSPALNAWIGIATVAKEVAAPGIEVRVETPSGPRQAILCKLPFLPRATMLQRPDGASVSAACHSCCIATGPSAYRASCVMSLRHLIYGDTMQALIESNRMALQCR